MKKPMKKTVELELKAHVDDPQACRVRLEALAGEAAAFTKDDAYWFLPEGETARLPSGVRIRQEQHRKPGTGAVSVILAAYKTKERREGIEVNDEREFAISGDTAVFEELLTRLGLSRKIVKNKQGFVWNYGGINAELCEVRGTAAAYTTEKNLGWFLELEILAGDGESGTVEKARSSLLALLRQAGIDGEKIEERYYSELLSL
jgi:adenylate cyclase class 2